MKFIMDNIKIFENGNSKLRSILFVHGFPFDHNMWKEQIKEFISDYYCITYDIRGLGESSSGDGQYSIETFIEDISFIIKELDLKKPILCGLSMGGYIAFRAIEKMEDKFGGIILCDTKPEADNNEAKLKRAEGIRKINEEGLKSFIPDFIKNCFSEEFQIRHSIEYNKIVENSLKFDPLGVKGCLLAMAGRTDTSSYLPQIKIPTLILCGEKDNLTPPATMKGISDKISNSEFYIVPASGHMSPIENPNFVNEKILLYLKRV